MACRLRDVYPPCLALWLGIGLLVGCEEEPAAPSDMGSPAFQQVTITDPTQVLTVGVDAPANLILKGTVAGIVIAVDSAVVDLSEATVDCRGQATLDDPKVGVWIKGNRSHAYIKGRGTGVITHCGAAVLVGPPAPMSGEPGGGFNHVRGLLVQHDDCPSGPYEMEELLCPVGIALSNTHGNRVTGNRIDQSEWGIVITGSDPIASGDNDITGNTIEGTQSFAIFATSDGNSIRGNVTTNVAGQTAGAIRVVGDSNVVTANTLSAFGTAVQLGDGAEGNAVTKNRVLEAWYGFDVSVAASHNVLRDNTALSTEGPSARDGSGACVNNAWSRNDFVNSDPLCIIGITLSGVSLASTTTQLEGAPLSFSSMITNQGTRLTGVALRSWVTQGPYSVRVRGPQTRRAGGFSPVDCDGAFGALPRRECPQTGDTLLASNEGGGRGTVAVGSATALIELVRVVGSDTGVVDSRTLPITITSPATGSYWEIMAPMPTPRRGLAVGVGEDVLYAVGGLGPVDWSVSARAVEAYDPISDSWSVRASLAQAIWNRAAAVIGDTLYVVGGFVSSYPNAYTGVVEAYDPGSNTWSARQPMPTPRDEVGLGVVNGVLYAVGGWTASGPTGVVEAYDPAANTWMTRASLPTPRRCGVGVIGGVLYAVGGYVGGSYSGAVEAYDPATDSWSSRASLAEGQDYAVGVLNGVLYAVGGVDSVTLHEYDPGTNTWVSKGTIPTQRWGLNVGVVNGLLYTVGGVPLYTNSYVGTVEAYHP